MDRRFENIVLFIETIITSPHDSYQASFYASLLLCRCSRLTIKNYFPIAISHDIGKNPKHGHNLKSLSGEDVFLLFLELFVGTHL